MNLDNCLADELLELKKKKRLRFLETLGTSQGPYIKINGKRYINLCSNDYFGLACDKRLIEGAVNAGLKWGVGSGASRLLSGNLELHEKLESDIADLVSMEKATLFSSGYLANMGLLSSVVGKEDIVFSDSLNHASIIDGARLAGGRVEVYPHLDIDYLEKKLLDAQDRFRMAFIVTESYFSMNGEIAPLKELLSLGKKYGAGLIVDEAHAFGVYGAGGGLCCEMGIEKEVFAMVGTLGKALGCQGAFVGGGKTLRNYLINRSRSLIFSTALSPLVAGAAIEAVNIVNESGAIYRDKLFSKAKEFRKSLEKMRLPVLESSTGHIVPLVLGSEKRALNLSEKLLKNGIFARAIRPPTVPAKSSRIRFSICVGHMRKDFERVVELISSE